MKHISKDTIIADFRKIGVKEGDILFITADLLNVGLFVKNKKETLKTWIDILLEVVGKEGTIIVASYTKTFFRFRKDKNTVFTRDSPTYAGDLATAFLRDPRSIRSRHPTHSCVAIGPHAVEILGKHDEKALSYEPLGRIIELNGKFVMLGTLDNKNAPQALHYAQEVLGHTKQFPYRGLFQTFFESSNGRTLLFTKKDFGGCSRGAYALYGPLIINRAIEFGKIGNADSAIMQAKKSFDVIIESLRRNRRIILCDEEKCIDCYGNFFNNGVKVIPFYISLFVRFLKGIKN